MEYISSPHLVWEPPTPYLGIYMHNWCQAFQGQQGCQGCQGYRMLNYSIIALHHAVLASNFKIEASIVLNCPDATRDQIGLRML